MTSDFPPRLDHVILVLNIIYPYFITGILLLITGRIINKKKGSNKMNDDEKTDAVSTEEAAA